MTHQEFGGCVTERVTACGAGPARAEAPAPAAPANGPRRRGSFRRRVVAGLAAALALGLGLGGVAHAQTSTTLVSNTSQTALSTPKDIGAGGGTSVEMAASFWTGSGGYVLTSVQVDSDAAVAGTDLYASIHTESIGMQGTPGTKVVDLTGTEGVVAGLNTLAAPSNTKLEASTTYFLVIGATGGTASIEVTNSDAEDAGSLTAWVIGNTRLDRTDRGAWSSDTAVPRFKVVGRVADPPGKPTNLRSQFDAGDNTTQLLWDAPSADANFPITSYRIETSPNGLAPWDDVVLDTESTTTVYDLGILLGATEYHYRVSAHSGAGSGALSDVFTFTSSARIPDEPSDVSAVAERKFALTLSWTAPHDGGSPIIEYRLPAKGWQRVIRPLD